MFKRIIETTDWKYIWLEFNSDTWMISHKDGINFKYIKTIDLDNGVIQYSNSNYIIITKLINND
jgi:hypothetical protein